jgi:elongator complex protein 1
MENVHLIRVSKRQFDPELDRLLCAPSSAFPLASDSLIGLYSEAVGRYLVIDSTAMVNGGVVEYPGSFIASYAAISPGGDFVILGGEKGAVRYGVEDGTFQEVYGIEGAIVAASYRADEKFFAVANAGRVVTYSNEGVVVQGSFETEGISAVAWNPQGTWLAVAAKECLFFREKNCRERQTMGFAEQLVAVAWSADPDILAVMDSLVVTILSTKNRVWHRKFTIPVSGDYFRRIFWASSDLSLSLVCDGDQVITYEFNHAVDSDDDSVFVVDGNVLLVSDWSRSLIPPPLCHRKYEVDSQITSVASDGNGTYAIFSQTSVTFVPSGEKYQIPESPVHASVYRDGQLYFAVGAIVYAFQGDPSPQSGFVSFLTPSFVVTDRVKIGDRTLDSPAVVFVQNADRYAVICANGHLYVGDHLRSTTAQSVLFVERLLSYIEIVNGQTMHTIAYDNETTAREVEHGAKLVFFCRRLFSIVIQMTRGNTETVAPHILVEAAMRVLIADLQYSEALRISKRCQVPFSRFIALGQISIEDLCSQIPDLQLRQFLPSLKPLSVPLDLSFLLQLLSYVLGVPVSYGPPVDFPAYDTDSDLLKAFATTVCIAFILLDSPVSAVRIACSFSTSDSVKSTISFLLTLYDANELYDISLRTYDTGCIASVGLVTMREPSTYVPFVEELNRINNPHLRNALIDEAMGDSAHAIAEYSKCGSDYEEKACYLIEREKAFDVGLKSFPKDSPIWTRICRLKLEGLADSGKASDIASTALQLHDPTQIVRFVKQIVEADMWRLTLRFLDRAGIVALRDALSRAKRFDDAAYVSLHYLDDKSKAAELFVKAHEWIKAVECGASEEEVADAAFKLLKSELMGGANEANTLKKKFMEVQLKQSEHTEGARRNAKNREKRGLPAIIGKLGELLPSEKRHREVDAIVGLLVTIGQTERAEELRKAFRALCKQVWPLPKLPNDEEQLVPPHLHGIL